ncbi:esterase 1 [Mycena rebaudengoi]|nr:esterase 1 [Mycena rebaudengoi]
MGDLEFFGGIPFAEPPIGDLRFKSAVLKPAPPTAQFDASNYGKSCLQPGVAPGTSSEDCLTINIFRPAGLLANASLPVMFWTYGGGFTSGGAGQYNASVLVAQSISRGTPIIYVSFNYRLGPLGFPQGSEVFQRGVLNLALHDQLTCLEWIQLNIGAFGGDNSKVVLFGQSAGSIMTSILFLTDISRLARAAIFQSGSAATSSLFTSDRGEADWQNFVGGVAACNAPRNNNSDTFDWLRSVESTDILCGWANASANTQVQFPWTPILDGPNGLIPRLPSEIWETGNFSHLPFIAGTNLDEGTIFTPNTPLNIDDFIIANFSPASTSMSDLQTAAQGILQRYPNDPNVGSPFNTGNQTFGRDPQYKRAAAIEGDISFQSQRRLWARSAAAAAGVKVFCYLFTQPQAVPYLGVYHGSEIRYVYGSGLGDPGVPASDANLSKMMIDYWLSFATFLDPNDGRGQPRPLWNAFTTENQVLMQLDGENTTMIQDTYRNEVIEYLMSMSKLFHH